MLARLLTRRPTDVPQQIPNSRRQSPRDGGKHARRAVQRHLRRHRDAVAAVVKVHVSSSFPRISIRADPPEKCVGMSRFRPAFYE